MSKNFKRIEARLHLKDDKDIIDFLNSSDDSNTRVLKRALRNYIYGEGDTVIAYAVNKEDSKYTYSELKDNKSKVEDKKSIILKNEKQVTEKQDVESPIESLSNKDKNPEKNNIVESSKSKELETIQENLIGNLEDDDDGILAGIMSSGKKL